MRANVNPETGIAYGYVAADELEGELVDTLLYGGHGVTNYINHSKDAAEESERNSHPELATEEWDGANERENFFEDYEGSEEQISGVFEGVTYQSSWMGGALNFFIFHSPVTTDKACRASPCVPNAAILKKDMDGGVEGYTVPAGWWAE